MENGRIVMSDLPKMGEGSKAHSKGGRVRKRTTQVVRAQRRTQKERGSVSKRTN